MYAKFGKFSLQRGAHIGPVQDSHPRRSAPIHRPTSHTAGAAKRMIRAVGLRLADEDPVDLHLLLEIEDRLREAWSTAVNGQRSHGFSDREIGEVLGVTHQAVQQRWPRIAREEAS